MQLKLGLVCLLATDCSGGHSTPPSHDPGDAAEPCAENSRRCDSSRLLACTGGVWTSVAECDSVCDPSLGCVACRPGTGVCEGDVSHACNASGNGYFDTFCDPVQGMACDGQTGLCQGSCSPQELGRSNLGCEYFPTTLANQVSPAFEFALAIANPSPGAAHITIEAGALPVPLTLEVAASGVEVVRLPWIPALQALESTLVARGAYRLRSTRPVIVYQFNPLDYVKPVGFSFSNDASLLLPVHALRGRYLVAAWPALPHSPSVLAITATAADTRVTITARAQVPGSLSAPELTAGVPASVVLARGDVLQLVGPSGDLTGSLIEADRPVQVVGGHWCANVPADTPYCDHLEESLFPIDTLGTSYVVSTPAVPPLPQGKEQTVRIIATMPGTTLALEPPVPGVATILVAAGDFVEIPRQAGDFVVTASHKVLVAQYMEGQTAGGDTGDPALVLAVPVAQYRLRSLFHAPLNYEVSYANVAAPLGARIAIDDVPVGDLLPVGSSGMGVARVELGQGLEGNHLATGDLPFTVSVYGYGQYTSYWYPGGLDLDEVPVE